MPHCRFVISPTLCDEGETRLSGSSMQTLRVNGVQESSTREYRWLYLNTAEPLGRRRRSSSIFNALSRASFGVNAMLVQLLHSKKKYIPCPLQARDSQ